MRNFCVSSREISDACSAGECADTSSACCACRVPSCRASFLSAWSASCRCRSRACCRVERESFMRATAILSGPMLKFWIVWWMSWLGGLFC